MSDQERDARKLARRVSIAKAEVVAAAIAYIDAKPMPNPLYATEAFAAQSEAVARYREAIAALEAHTHE